MRLRAGALYLIECMHHLLYGGIEIGHIKPYGREKKDPVDYQFENPTQKGIAPHRVEHLVVFSRELVDLVDLLAIGIHSDDFIMPSAGIGPTSFPEDGIALAIELRGRMLT